MRRELRSEKKASQWEESFPVGRQLPNGKRAASEPVVKLLCSGRELASGKAAS